MSPTAREFIQQKDQEGEHWSNSSDLIAVALDEYAALKISQMLLDKCVDPVRCRFCINEKCRVVPVTSCEYEPRYVPLSPDSSGVRDKK